MKSNQETRGKPSSAAVFYVSLLIALIGVLGVLIHHNAGTADASAVDKLSLKAWSGAGVVTDGDTGGFVAWATKQYSKYDLKLDKSLRYINVYENAGSGKTKTFDLDERVDNDDVRTPRRYWFWVKDNKQRSTQTYWRTNLYVATTKKITGPPYNTLQYDSKGDAVELTAWAIKNGGLFTQIKKDGVDYAGKVALDGYAIDIKKWYDRAEKEQSKYTGVIRLQTVADVHVAGRGWSGPCYTSTAWSQGGYRPSDYVEKYNQWIMVENKSNINLQVYKVETENNDEYPTDGEMDIDNREALLDKTDKKRIEKISLLDTTAIKTYKDDVTGDEYYLTGVRVEQQKKSNEDDWDDLWHFYLKETSIIGTDNKTSGYSQPGGSNEGKNTFVEEDDKSKGVVMYYKNSYKYKYDDTNFSLTSAKTNITSDSDYKEFENPDPLTGKHTYDEIADYMTSLKFKAAAKDVRVCLVYTKVDSSVTLKKEIYDWSESGDEEHDVDASDLIDTANKDGYSQPKDLIQQVADAWTYGNVTIPGNMKVSEGSKNTELLSKGYDGSSLPIPSSLSATTLNNCLQNWYGEYYLPNTIHVRLASSDAAFEADAAGGYDYTESYWCNKGYLLVNFTIYTVKDGQKHLLYNAQSVDSGYCDMWVKENRVSTKKDSWGQMFNFKEGDFILYDLSSSMSDDYKTGGTH